MELVPDTFSALFCPDWRLQGQERFLHGVTLLKKRYHKYRDGWEHDHCEFCGRKFSEAPGDMHIGYATTDNYHWVCEDCFNDFSQVFDWKVSAGSEIKGDS
jgi:hypothetical protein